MTDRDYLFSFNGRINRGSFWFFWIFTSIFGGAVGVAPFTDFWKDGLKDYGPIFLVLWVIIFLVILVPATWIGLAAQVKRFHDRDKSGWKVLVNLIPILGSLLVIVELTFLRGTEGPNKYGDEEPSLFVTECPQCGSGYNLLDKVSQPKMCKNCWQSHRAKQPA